MELTPHKLLDLLILRYSMPLPEGNEASVQAFKQKQQAPIQIRFLNFLFFYFIIFFIFFFLIVLIFYFFYFFYFFLD